MFISSLFEKIKKQFIVVDNVFKLQMATFFVNLTAI